MTKEEAIKWVDDRMCWGRGTFTENHPPNIDECWEAGVMAIKALKREAERQEMTIRASERHLGLVRCKDCKHYSVEGKTTQFGWCNALEMPTDEQRFCSDGERKEP